MPRYRDIQNNLLAGELDPKAHSRTDIREFSEGAEELKNVLVQPQGGATKRMGTEFIPITEIDSGAEVDVEIPFGSRIVPFIFSKEDKKLVIIPPDSYDIYIWDPNIKISKKLTFKTVSGFTVPDESYGGIEFETKFTIEELKEVQFAQSGDTLYLTHPNHAPRKIVRTSLFDGGQYFYDMYWSVDDGTTTLPLTVNDAEKYPWEPFNSTATTLSFDFLTAGLSRTLTASAPLFVDDTGAHNPNLWAGSMFAVSSASTGTATVGVCVVLQATSATTAIVDIITDIPANGLTSWQTNEWSRRNGYPRSLTFYEQRLCFGGSKSVPAGVWFSAAGDILRFSDINVSGNRNPGGDSVTQTADMSILQSIAQKEANQIQWMTGDSVLNVGTSGREFVISSGVDATSTPAASVSPETAHGSNFTMANRIENVLIFNQRSGKRVREFVFNRDEQSFRSQDLSLYYGHLVDRSIGQRTDSNDSEIIRFINQEADNSVIWFLDSNGYVFTTTRRRLLQVNAATRMEFGGEYESSETPYVHSIEVLPSINGEHDDVYLCVSRVIDGEVKTYIEKINEQFSGEINNDSNDVINKPTYSDSFKFERIHTKPELYLNMDSSTIKYVDAGVTESYTPTGTPVFAGGKLELGVADGADWADTSLNLDLLSPGIGNKFSIKINFSLDDTTDDTAADLFFLFSPGANQIFSRYDQNIVNMLIRDDSGATIFDLDLVRDFKPVQDKIHELAYTVDFDNNFIKFFIDGVLQGTWYINIDTATQWADPKFENLTIGKSSQAFKIDEFAVFSNRREFDTNYTPVPINETWIDAADGDDYTVNNLDHLEGETVNVLIDGAYVGTEIVSSGSITIDNGTGFFDKIFTGTKDRIDVIVGLDYQARIVDVPINTGVAFGTAQGAISRIDTAILRFDRTVGAKIGLKDGTLDEIIFRPTDLPMEDAIPLFTGDKLIQFPGGPNRRVQVEILSDVPLPLTVTGIILRGQGYD